MDLLPVFDGKHKKSMQSTRLHKTLLQKTGIDMQGLGAYFKNFAPIRAAQSKAKTRLIHMLESLVDKWSLKMLLLWLDLPYKFNPLKHANRYQDNYVSCVVPDMQMVKCKF